MRTTPILKGCGLAAAALGLGAALLSPYRYFGIATDDDATAAKPRPAVLAARPSPLLGADGTPQAALPQAVPADPHARTRAALYATRVQAHALETELDGAVIWVETNCCDERAVSFALDLTDGLRIGRHLALDAPVFVTGQSLHLAALVADRLTDEGHTLVFLVTR